jgi:hypothetical protein
MCGFKGLNAFYAEIGLPMVEIDLQRRRLKPNLGDYISNTGK